MPRLSMKWSTEWLKSPIFAGRIHHPTAIMKKIGNNVRPSERLDLTAKTAFLRCDLFAFHMVTIFVGIPILAPSGGKKTSMR